MVTDAVGATGTAGTALTTSGVGAETQVLSVVDLAVTLCAPGATSVNVADTWNAPPSRLYSYAPSGAVTTMVPVGTARTALTTSGVGAETQVLSVVDLAVTLCAPGATSVNVADTCYF